MSSLGFGIERVGLAALRRPKIAVAIFVVFSVMCAIGVTKVKTDHSLSELFRSSTPEYEAYKKLSDTFPTSEFDVLVVAEAPTLMRPELLEEIRTLHLDLELVEAVDGVLSIFSMRLQPDEDGVPEALFPAELPQGEAFEKLSKRALAHPLVGDRLLSLPGKGNSQITLLILSLKPEVIANVGNSPAINEIDAIAREILEPAGIKVQLAGAPVMQREIREAIRRDRLIYNSSGFLVGLVIALAFFRRIKIVVITSVCTAVSVLWAIGLLGWFDLRLNTFINVIPPLVMVIAFTDAMHMIFSIRRRMAAGDDRFAAARHAVKTVGPACVLTSLTTSIAFLSLTLTDSGLIRTFGFAASLSTLLAFIAVIVVVPVMVVLLFKDGESFKQTERTRGQALARLERGCAALATWIEPRHVQVASIGVILVIVFTAFHLQLKPSYRLSDQVPDTKQSVAASERLDEKLTGALPIHVMLEWKKGKTVTTPEITAAIKDSHESLEEQAGIGNIWSVETLRRWLADINKATPAELADYLGRMPVHLVQRFVNNEANAALVTGRLPNLDAGDSVGMLRDLDARLGALRDRYPDVTFTVTGLSAVSAMQSSNMIAQLNRGLMIAIVVVIVLIGAAFRSLRIAVLSIIPNLFPIVAAGTVIYLTGGGLEYASVIALTVAFGIAVDDSIHFFNRFQIETDRNATVAEAVHHTISRIGPVLIVTTLVLVVGLAVTVFSDLPAMRLFGTLFMTTLAAALVGDVLILPAVILSLRRWGLVRSEV